MSGACVLGRSRSSMWMLRHMPCSKVEASMANASHSSLWLAKGQLRVLRTQRHCWRCGTRLAPHPWASEEPSTYKVHKGWVRSRVLLLAKWTKFEGRVELVMIWGTAKTWGSVSSEIKFATACPFVTGRGL
ncbi:unnamed protein product [Prunus armeniaca]